MDEKTEKAIDLVKNELLRAYLEFPSFKNPHEGIAIIREEYLELEREVFNKQADMDNMKKEAAHVAAMGIRFIVNCFDKEKNE